MKKLYKIKVNGKTYKVELQGIDEIVTKDAPKAAAGTKEAAKEAPKAAAPSGEGKTVASPIQGTVVAVKVKPGDKVKKGAVLLLIEAMKLENEVNAPCDGIVGEVLVSKGTTVTTKQPLLTIK